MKGFIKVTIVTFLLSLMILGSSGCQKSSEPEQKKPSEPSEPKKPEELPSKSKVSIQNVAFEPAEITVSKGETVTWTNKDSVTHTVTGDGFDSGELAKGGTYSFTFSKAGTFEYHCSIHSSMEGSVIVK